MSELKFNKEEIKKQIQVFFDGGNDFTGKIEANTQTIADHVDWMIHTAIQHDRNTRPNDAKKKDYAYPTIEEYEKIAGHPVNDAFKIGWDMARTTNAMLGIEGE